MKISSVVASRKRQFDTATCVDEDIAKNLAKRVAILEQYVGGASYVRVSPQSFAVLQSIKKLIDDFRIVSQAPTPVFSRDVWMCILEHADIKTIKKMRLMSKALARYGALFVRHLCAPTELTSLHEPGHILPVFTGAETLTIECKNKIHDEFNALFKQGRPGLLFVIKGASFSRNPTLHKNTYDLNGASIKGAMYSASFRNVHCHIGKAANAPYVVLSFSQCILSIVCNHHIKAMYIYESVRYADAPNFVEQFYPHTVVYLDEEMSRSYTCVNNVRKYFSGIKPENLILWTGRLPDFVPRHFKYE